MNRTKRGDFLIRFGEPYFFRALRGKNMCAAYPLMPEDTNASMM